MRRSANDQTTQSHPSLNKAIEANRVEAVIDADTEEVEGAD